MGATGRRPARPRPGKRRSHTRDRAGAGPLRRRGAGPLSGPVRRAAGALRASRSLPRSWRSRLRRRPCGPSRRRRAAATLAAARPRLAGAHRRVKFGGERPTRRLATTPSSRAVDFIERPSGRARRLPGRPPTVWPDAFSLARVARRPCPARACSAACAGAGASSGARRGSSAFTPPRLWRAAAHVARASPLGARRAPPGRTRLCRGRARGPAGLATAARRSGGADVMLLIDVSSSMQALDFRARSPRRAHAFAERLVDRRPDDRIGLMTFASRTALRCPLTRDHEAVRLAIRDLTPGAELLGEGTALGAAMLDAVERLASGAPAIGCWSALRRQEHPRVGVHPRTRRRCGRRQVRIHTIGIGSGGAVPYPDGIRPGGRRAPARRAALSADRHRSRGRVLRAPDEIALRAVSDAIDELESPAPVEVVDPRSSAWPRPGSSPPSRCPSRSAAGRRPGSGGPRSERRDRPAPRTLGAAMALLVCASWRVARHDAAGARPTTGASPPPATRGAPKGRDPPHPRTRAVACVPGLSLPRSPPHRAGAALPRRRRASARW